MDNELMRCNHCNRIVIVAPYGDVWSGFYAHMEDGLPLCWDDTTYMAEVNGEAMA
jgi:hypothetical protein